MAAKPNSEPKSMKLLLVASLILNVLLLGGAVRHIPRHRSAEFARPLRMQISNAAARRFNSSSHRSASDQAPATLWQAIESPDPAQFVANLRALGCPEQTIRDIAVFRLSREFHARLQAPYDDAARQELWWFAGHFARIDFVRAFIQIFPHFLGLSTFDVSKSPRCF